MLDVDESRDGLSGSIGFPFELIDLREELMWQPLETG
jgi:hypothetical protein